MKVIPCTDSAVQGNDFELIPAIRMERGHSVDGSLSREFFHRSISLGSYRRMKSEVVCDDIKNGLSESDPLRENFENVVPKGFTTLQNHVLCANLVKFGRPKIGKVVRY